MISKVKYLQHWPKESTFRRLASAAKKVLVYDRALEMTVNEHFSFIDERIAIDAGESAKSIENFARLAENILPRVAGFAPSEIALIAIGGGSIGDLVGFTASVLKRGVRLVHVPSTYLAAMDSAHGGKTALNLSSFKNQIGTFYPAELVLCVKPLLDAQPEINLRSGYGELIKMSLLVGGPLFRALEAAKTFDGDLMWQLLPQTVAAKKKIVARDPLEKKGLRHLLNLGHTFGHTLELEQNLPHGLAVLQGLDFCVEWSRKLGLMRERDYEKSKALLTKSIMTPKKPLSSARLSQLLRQDKKATNNGALRFVLLKKPGRPVIKELKIENVVAAAVEMDWAQ
jgi:3-dehydroquinate synthase